MTKRKQTKSDGLDDLRVGLYEAATLIGKSIQHVRDCVRDGFIPAAVGGKYRAIDVASGALKAREHRDRQASQSAAASRIHDARAAEIELRTAERKRKHLVEAQADAIRVIDEIAGPLKSDLMAIPAQVTTDLALRRRIEDKIDGAFGEASKRAFAAADRMEMREPLFAKPVVAPAAGKRRGSEGA